jgi:hypothetical protein
MRCRYCDAELRPEDRVCPSCGQRVAFMPNEIPAGGWARPAPAMSEAGTATTATAVLDEPAMDLAQTPENALYVDSTRLVLLLVLSSGLYIFYWTFLTWKQLELGRQVASIILCGTPSRCLYLSIVSSACIVTFR